METIQLGKQSVLTEGSMNISFKFINAKKCREKCENFFFYRSNLLEETADCYATKGLIYVQEE